MKEKLSIMQMIAEEKAIKKSILDIINEDFKLVSYYQKNRPFVGARSVEEQEKQQKAKLQSINDLLVRLSAIKRAHTKANRETLVMVPAEPILFNFINGKSVDNEEITIAEAINRKNNYMNRKNSMFTDSPNISMYRIAQELLQVYTHDFNAKNSFDERARSEVQEQLNRRFPSDSKNSWSQERYAETKKLLEEEAEVIRIDPFGLVDNEAIRKYYDAIRRYILDIDTIISQANASTIVEFEY